MTSDRPAPRSPARYGNSTVSSAARRERVPRCEPLIQLPSTSLQTADTGFEFDSDPLGEAQDVDEVLRNSVSLGFATRAVTGFDHLVQDIPLTIDAAGLTPAIPNSSAADSLQGAASGLFLVVYFGEVDEVEIAGGEEIEVVTPFFSDQWEILSTGVELSPGS